MGTAKELRPEITLENELITVISPSGSQIWTMSLRDLALIGEYTDSNGPYVDDYFFIFVNHSGEWAQVSYYDEGLVEFFDAIGGYLKSELKVGLQHSTDLASRVIWPTDLAGEDLFEFVPVVRTSLWRRLWQRLIPICDIHLAKGVNDYLASI
jgi:hypothetical protein